MTGDTVGGGAAPAPPSPPGPARVTLDDVARRAGVSSATASRALGDHPHVASSTRARVREAAAALDYVASPEAARLAGGPGPTGRVAVLVPHPARWFYGELLEGLEAALRSADLDLVLFRVGGPEERAAFFDRLPARRKVDAVVVLGFDVDEREHARLASLGVDVVAAAGHVPSCPRVGVDDHVAGRQATDHLIHLGHRRIGVITGGGGRRRAWRAALADAGIEPDDDLVATVPPGGEEGEEGGGGGADGMARLLGLRSPPTAVVAHDDETALGAVRTLRRAGLRVPDDLSVVGVDDHPLAALTDLTTVARPVRALGRRAGELVRAALRGELRERVPPAELLATRLVLRGTTSPPGALR